MADKKEYKYKKKELVGEERKGNERESSKLLRRGRRVRCESPINPSIRANENETNLRFRSHFPTQKRHTPHHQLMS